MVGGRVIDISVLAPDGCRRYWCMDCNGDETAVFGRDPDDGIIPGIGDEIWWQAGKIYFDRDRRSLIKVGNSHSRQQGKHGRKMVDLFCGEGSDPEFLAIRDNESFSKERAECERLWSVFSGFQGKDFIHEFSEEGKFRHRFWEMWLGVKLKELCGTVVRPSSGPDFRVEYDHPAYVEATVIERGTGKNAIPNILTRCADDCSVPFRECVLRLTNKLSQKQELNNAGQIGSNHSYVLAVNLPFPEAWLCSTPPLAAQAFLGGGSNLVRMQDDGSWQSGIAWKPSLKNHNESEVKTTTFLDGTYCRVSAIIVASVNLLSSSYPNPALEILHNPTATHPLPRGWFNFGYEYWFENEALWCRQHQRPQQP